MNVPFVDLKAQYTSIKAEIDSAIEGILNNTSFIGGLEVEKFEESFAAFQGANHCVSCANGTDAIEIALEALEIGPGDEVIVPAYTWISTASAVSRVGAKPVFVDVDEKYYTIDPTKISEKLTSATKAIIPVHFYGLPANMPAIMSLAKEHELLVIEDCAQAHGAEINGQRVGTFGDIGTFSFYPGKNLGGYGDGGSMVTQDQELADKCRIISRLGQVGKHNHVAIGRNSRLDTLQAAILNVKLQHLESWTSARRVHADTYCRLLEGENIQLPVEPQGFHHVYHVFMVQLDDRNAVKKLLEKQGIQTQLHYPKPITQLAPYQEKAAFPISDQMANRMISLPMYAEMPEDQMEFVVDQLKAVL